MTHTASGIFATEPTRVGEPEPRIVGPWRKPVQIAIDVARVSDARVPARLRTVRPSALQSRGPRLGPFRCW